MKKITVLLFFWVLLFSCKKNKNEAPPETLLSQTYTNGHKSERFHYSPGNKLTRYDLFSSQPGNALSYYYILEYDQDDNISQLTYYKEPGGIALNRIITKATGGKIDSAYNYDLQSATPNVPASTTAYTYNANGQLTKLQSKDKNKKLLYYINYSYYPDGTLKQSDQYDEESNVLYLRERYVYSLPGTTYPKGLEALKPIISMDYIARLHNDNIQVFDYSQAGVITFNRKYQMSAREYDEDGALTRQTITVKKIKPADTDEIVYKEYEYIKQ